METAQTVLKGLLLNVETHSGELEWYEYLLWNKLFYGIRATNDLFPTKIV